MNQNTKNSYAWHHMILTRFPDLDWFIQDHRTKTNTNVRDVIPANIKLAATIRFLATSHAKLFCWFLSVGFFVAVFINYLTCIQQVPFSFPGFNISVDCFAIIKKVWEILFKFFYSIVDSRFSPSSIHKYTVGQSLLPISHSFPF